MECKWPEYRVASFLMREFTILVTNLVTLLSIAIVKLLPDFG